MATKMEVLAFDADRLSQLLQERVASISLETLSSFREQKITGEDFLELTDADLKELVKTLGEKKQIQRVIESYKPTKVSAKLSDL